MESVEQEYELRDSALNKYLRKQKDNHCADVTGNRFRNFFALCYVDGQRNKSHYVSVVDYRSNKLIGLIPVALRGYDNPRISYLHSGHKSKATLVIHDYANKDTPEVTILTLEFASNKELGNIDASQIMEKTTEYDVKAIHQRSVPADWPAAG